MANNKKTLVQRIALDGGEQIRRELQGLGEDGRKAFDAMRKAADHAAPATSALNRNLLQLRASAANVRDQFQKLGAGLGPLTRGIAQIGVTFAAAFSVRALIDMTSAWTDLTSQVRLYIPENENASDVMERLQQTARGTYSSFQQTAEGFIRNSAVLRELGLSTQQQLDYQEALNNALVVSGARGERAARVNEALAKSMALGRVQGDQLNTILADGGRIVTLLTESLGITRGELIQMSAQGQLTGEVLKNTLLANLTQLREEAASMPATILDGFLQIQNALLVYIGTRDEATGTSAAIADGLLWLADNIDLVVNGFLILAGLIAVIKGVGLAIALVEIGVALVGLIGPLAAVGAALLVNPMTLWALAITTAAIAILALTGNLDNFVEIVGKVVEPLSKAMGAMGEVGEEGGDAIEGAAEKTGDLSTNAGIAVENLVKMGESGNTAGDSINEMAKTGSQSITDLNTSVDTTTSSISNLISEVEHAISSFDRLNSSSSGGGSTGGNGSDIQEFAGGGRIRGKGTGTSDSILARVSNGEYILKAAAVRKYGKGVLDALNGMRLPQFNLGGGVSDVLSGMGSAPIVAAGISTSSGQGSSGRPLSLTIGDETFEGLIAPEVVADKLIRFATGRKVRRAGSVPSWYGG